MQYPFSNTFELKASKANWFSSILIATLVYLFLIVFQPFGTYNYQHSFKYILLIPYSIIAFTVFFVNSFLKGKKSKAWSWKAQIKSTFYLLLVCSLLNYFYNLYFINHSNFSLNNFAYMVVFTLSLGIPICTIDLLIRRNLFHSLYPKNITLDKPIASEKVKHPVDLCIQAENNQNLSIERANFVFAKSEGNYSCIHYLKNGKLEKTLLRISFKQLEKQICSPIILRCHRSYIINTEKVKNKKGNANGYQLTIEKTDQSIPVSRSYLHLLKTF